MTGTRTRESAAVALALSIAAWATPAGAQEHRPEIRSGFELVPFQFFPPGARSLGMGATFVAVADDATASASNPAGLVILTKPEVSAHGRFSSFSGSTVATGTTPAFTLDFSASSPSFFSVVVPVGPVRVAGYYQTAARAKPALFQPQQPGVDVQDGMNLLVDDIGESLAVRLGSWAAVGASVASRRVRLSYFMDQRFAVPGQGLIYADRLTVGEEQQGVLTSTEDRHVVFNAGLLLNPNGRVSFGLIYKSGGDFKLPYKVTVAAFSPETVACRQSANSPCGRASLRLPDTLGAGFALRPNDRWLLSADVNYIRYSRYGASSLMGAPIDQYPPATNFFQPVPFDDVTQVNAGVEYTIPSANPVSFRAGVFLRPSYADVVAPATFVTAGAGVVLRERFQLDAAASVSDELWEAVLSLVVRF